MDIGLIEKAIIEHLQNNFPDFDVESFPAKFEDYTFSSAIGCLLVKYDRTDYSTQKSLWEVSQEAVCKWTIVAGYRSLQFLGDIHKPQKKLKDCLRGLEVEGYKFILDSEQFEAEIDGDLYCSLSIKINCFTQETENFDNEI